MPYKKYPVLKKKDLKTISISDRKSLVDIKSFAQPFAPGSSFESFLKALPDSLSARDLIEFSNQVKNARKRDKPIIFGMGAHTIKVGLNPIIIDLMERGWVSAISVNGAFMIHDFEIALCGKTSEDVSENLFKGTYGNTEETGLFLNIALKDGLENDFGCGESIGYYLMQSEFPYNKHSVLYHAYKLNIPITIHPAIGTDFIHYHPNFDGGVLGTL
ncbi:deoxyhypusine synthase family protein, partial [bacterium]|nr:deoxyhypusine synthase family protein [bacterium]